MLVQKTLTIKMNSNCVVTKNKEYIVLKDSKDLIIYTNDCDSTIKSNRTLFYYVENVNNVDFLKFSRGMGTLYRFIDNQRGHCTPLLVPAPFFSV